MFILQYYKSPVAPVVSEYSISYIPPIYTQAYFYHLFLGAIQNIATGPFEQT